MNPGLKKKVIWSRRIIHIDMDAFFAAIEQRDFPEYRGKPLIVGGDPGKRGVVSTCSYEARRFGVHSAMPARTARRLCPEGIFVRPRFAAYKEASRQVMAILRQHTELVEKVSIDEAYLDVTRHRFGIEDPVLVAAMIKQNIHAATHLTASAGVAERMFLAKIASDMKKPDGLTVVNPGTAIAFLDPLPVRKIPGVGKVTEAELAKLGLETCAQVRALEESRLIQMLGKFGAALYRRVHGEDSREVTPYSEPKQSSSEETFDEDTRDMAFMRSKLQELSGDVFRHLEKYGRTGLTVVLKVKYHDFEQITRSRTLRQPPESAKQIAAIAERLLVEMTQAGEKPVRLLGVGISGLIAHGGRAPEPDLFAGESFHETAH